MFSAISREMLGQYGRILLDFFLNNRLIISLIIILYGVILLVAHQNLKAMAQKALDLKGSSLFDHADPALVLAEEGDGFWEELKKAFTFPILSMPSSFLIYRTTRANQQKLLASYILYRQKIYARRR